MLELHGWIVVRDTPDYEGELMEEIIEKIVKKLRKYNIKHYEWGILHKYKCSN